LRISFIAASLIYFINVIITILSIIKLITPEINGVASQQKTIFLIMRKFNRPAPLTKPTPKIAPTIEWLVETGIPAKVYTWTFIALANCADKAITGRRCVISEPIVSITL